ncbi:hypothetical protein EDD17DRAFT_1895110 [Pisolithus thermaeus]|nr:hypothetical protein EDD17DRAFT_1895110 [Pisolithus thermaeus]
MRSIFRRSPKSDKSSPTQSSPSGQFTTSPHPRPISPLANEIPQSGPGSWQESSTTQSQQHGVDQASRHTVMQEDVADFELAPVNSRNDSFIGTLYQVLGQSSFQHGIVWSDSGTSFIVMDVEAFKRHVLGPLFHDLPFADFVQKLDAYDFRTTIKNIRFRNLSATSEGWEFSRPSFRRTTIPSASASDFLSLSNFEPSVEVPPKVAYLLARAQDDISNYRREINYLRGHGSPGRASPGSPSPRVVSPLLQPVKDDDEHVSTQSLSEFQHHDHPDVHIHPPTPGPPSPQTDVEDLPSPGNEVDISPAFPSAMLSDPKSSSSSPSHTLRGIEPRYSPWPSSRTSPSSEPSSLLSPSHTHSAPFGQPSSYGEDRDDWEMNLVDSLARTGLSRDASRGTEYVDSNMTSPDLADPEEVRSLISDIVNRTMESLPTPFDQHC